MRKILFVINPVSGDLNKTQLKDELNTLAKRHEFAFSSIETTGNNDKRLLSKALANYEPETVVIAGGDGTVSLVASLLTGSGIILGIIPMGSANGLAYELGMPGNIESAVNIISKQKTLALDAVKIGDRYSFHLSDIGMNARIIKRFEKEGKRGFAGYFRQFLKEFRNIRKFKCKIEADGKTIAHHALVAVIANGSYYGTGASINPTGKFNDGKFEIILIRPYPSWFILKLAFAFFTRKLHKLEYIEIVSCKKAVIQANPPQDLQIDGEIIGKSNRVEAEILPDALQVIYNEKGFS